MTKPLIVCCSPDYGEDWRRLGPRLTGEAAAWEFYDDRPIYVWEKLFRRPNMGMLRACLNAVRRAAKEPARILITLDPRATFLCALFCRILRVRAGHYVFSFNFPELPIGLRHYLMRYAFRQVDSFMVHSSMERSLYSRYFDIPKERIQLRMWSIGPPAVFPEYPLQEGRYVSSIGGNGRDYKTLLEAAHKLPHILFVLVVRPDSLAGLEIPANVKIIVNAPFGEAMNILRHSTLTVLPLSGSTVPCGHVTLVCAMHLARAVVVTDSAGIYDYVRSGYNGMLCEPFSSESMAQAIAKLWANPSEIARLSDNNHRFGSENCTEDKMSAALAVVLSSWNIPLCQEAASTAVLQRY